MNGWLLCILFGWDFVSIEVEEEDQGQSGGKGEASVWACSFNGDEGVEGWGRCGRSEGGQGDCYAGRLTRFWDYLNSLRPRKEMIKVISSGFG